MIVGSTDRSTWWWAGMHLLLALSIPILLVTLIGCKKARATKEDLGSPISSERVNQALDRAINGATYRTSALDTFVNYSHTRRLENEEGDVSLGTRRVDVIDRKDVDTDTVFTFHILEVERRDTVNGKETWRNLEMEDSFSAPKVTTSHVEGFLKTLSEDQLIADMHAQEAFREKGSITFHNLRESDDVMSPPDAMKSRPNCGGIPGCILHVRYLQFDLVIWGGGSDYQKISFDLAFSLDTPYLPYGEFFQLFNGALVTDCRSTLVPWKGRTVFVRDCYNIDDFKK